MECRWVQGDVDDGGSDDDVDDGDDDADDDCMFECRWMVICQGLVVLCVCAPTSNSLLAPYYMQTHTNVGKKAIHVFSGSVKKNFARVRNCPGNFEHYFWSG